jgi:hypothetical protein
MGSLAVWEVVTEGAGFTAAIEMHVGDYAPLVSAWNYAEIV